MTDTVNKKYAHAHPDELVEHPANPRVGDVAAIRESIEANGFYGALVAQRDTKHVLVGNHRLKAARELGMDRVPVLWVDVDDVTAKRILLADNRSSDLANYDNESLRALLDGLNELDELPGSLWSQTDLDELVDLLDGLEPVGPGGGDAPGPPVDDTVIVSFQFSGPEYNDARESLDEFIGRVGVVPHIERLSE